jgi:hypothetical protein
MQPVHNWLQRWRGLMARAVHRAAALIASNSLVSIGQLMWTPAATDPQTGTGQTLGIAVPAQLMATLRKMQPEEQREFARMALVTVSKQASDPGDTGTPSVGEQLYRTCRLLACSDEDLLSVRSEPNDLAAAAASAHEETQLECNPQLRMRGCGRLSQRVAPAAGTRRRPPSPAATAALLGIGGRG